MLYINYLSKLERKSNQVLNNHTWLVSTIVNHTDASIITERSFVQCCKSAAAFGTQV